MSKGVYLDYLQDIIDAAKTACGFVEGMSYDVFVKDTRTVYAVIRALEIVGEATKNIPLDVREQHPHIPWPDMAGMRDRLIHAYAKVDVGIVWETVQDDLPRVLPQLEKILAQAMELGS